MPPRNPAQRGLTPADVEALLRAAQTAWDHAPPRARQALLTWRGRRYRVHSTAMRLLVQTVGGLPVACRYH